MTKVLLELSKLCKEILSLSQYYVGHRFNLPEVINALYRFGVEDFFVLFTFWNVNLPKKF